MLSLLHHHFTGYCTCSRSNLPGVAFAAPSFYWTLHLQQITFTRCCLCCSIILLDITLAVHQFYWTLHLQQINFTRCCLCCPIILLDITLAADQFYQVLPLLSHHFTGYYTCSAPILPDIVLAIDQFYQMLPLLAPLFYQIFHLQKAQLYLLQPLPDTSLRSIGVWETQPIWDNLITFFDLPDLLPPDQESGLASGCASTTTPCSRLPQGLPTVYLLLLIHRHVSEGLYEYLHAFWGPGSHTK